MWEHFLFSDVQYLLTRAGCCVLLVSVIPSGSDERNYWSGFPFASDWQFRVHCWPRMTVYIRAKKNWGSGTKIMTISDAKIINFLLSESSFINCVGCQIKIERWSSGYKEENMNAPKSSSSSRHLRRRVNHPRIVLMGKLDLCIVYMIHDPYVKMRFQYLIFIVVAVIAIDVMLMGACQRHLLWPDL